MGDCHTRRLPSVHEAKWGRFRTACAQRQLLHCLSREHPRKPPPYRSVHDPFKTASGVQNSGPWDPWQASDIVASIRTKNAWCTSRGCRVQNSGPPGPVATGGEKQPTFRTARAQHAHSARCAPNDCRLKRTPVLLLERTSRAYPFLGGSRWSLQKTQLNIASPSGCRKDSRLVYRWTGGAHRSRQ